MRLDRPTLESLSSEYGDAFYILDSGQFRENFARLKEAFSSIYGRFNIAYSYKTNYIPKLCSIANELGGYAEVVSEMELELALRVGVRPERIIWNGPVKNPAWVRRLLLSGGTVNVDSLGEMRGIVALADEEPKRILNVGIRCNFPVGDGVLSRFGFDVDGPDFAEAVAATRSRPNLNLVNLQCHFAKRQAEFWPARARGMLELVDRIGFVPKRLDIGGGLFGNMPDSLRSQFDCAVPGYDAYAAAAAGAFAERFSGRGDAPELLIEPGSALVGDCMRFAGRIKTVKTVRGKTIATMLGSQKNISMAGVNPPFEVVHMGGERQSCRDADIVGYTCIEGDRIVGGFSGDLAVGDFVVVSNCGSYSVVMKPPFILPNFPILEPTEGGVEVVKRAETFGDVFATYGL